MLDLDAKDESQAYIRLRQCLRISAQTIDDDIVQHANIHQEICEWHAWAKRRAAKAFASQRSRAATHITDSRKSLSEDTSKRAWEASSDYKDAANKMMDCNRSVDAWEGLRESSIQKSYMINNLVDLVAGGHVSTTRRPRDKKKARLRLKQEE